MTEVRWFWGVHRERGAHREGKGVEGVVASSTLALDGLEESDAAEDLGERGPQENLGHATGLDKEIVGGDGVDLVVSGR